MTKSTTHLLKATLFTSVLFSSALFAGQAEIDRIEAATANLDIATLSSLSSELEGYDYSLAQYRLAMSANLKQQNKLALTAINNSIETLESLNQVNSNNAEVKALLAHVYGYKISLKPLTAIVNGPKVQKMLEEAEQIAPSNPRVLLVKGISAMFTPAFFGGSNDLAMEAITQALEAYKHDFSSNYHWGYAEAQTWKGVLEQKNGNIEQAKADWQQALMINQDYGWAKILLASI
jgi:tetratricopeptide (TPR) repeat protein